MEVGEVGLHVAKLASRAIVANERSLLERGAQSHAELARNVCSLL